LRAEREKSGLKAEEDRRWFESLPDGGGALPSGSTEAYSWVQSEEEVEVVFSPGPFRGICATRRDLTVRIGRKSLFVRLRGRLLLDATLSGEVDTGSSYWTFGQDKYELQVTLVKVASCKTWPDLLAPSAAAQALPGDPPATLPCSQQPSAVALAPDDGPDVEGGAVVTQLLDGVQNGTPGAGAAGGAIGGARNRGGLGATPPRREAQETQPAEAALVRKRRGRSLTAWGLAALALYYVVLFAVWTQRPQSQTTRRPAPSTSFLAAAAGQDRAAGTFWRRLHEKRAGEAAPEGRAER
jgi:hypothetical protein